MMNHDQRMRVLQLREADPNGKNKLARTLATLPIGSYFWHIGTSQPVRFTGFTVSGKVRCAIPGLKWSSYRWEFCRQLTDRELTKYRKGLEDAVNFYHNA